MATHLWVDLKMKIQNLKHMKTIINISSTWSLVMNTRPDPKINHHHQKWTTTSASILWNSTRFATASTPESKMCFKLPNYFSLLVWVECVSENKPMFLKICFQFCVLTHCRKEGVKYWMFDKFVILFNFRNGLETKAIQIFNLPFEPPLPADTHK